MEADTPQSGGFQQRQEVAPDEVGDGQYRADLRWEDEFIADALVTARDRFQEYLIPQIHKHISQFLAHIHASRLFTLSGQKLPRAAVVSTLNQDVSVCIVRASTKLDVSPFQSNEFTFP